MAFNITKLVSAIKKTFGTKVAGSDTDPQFFSSLQALPNPDPILRKLGLAETVYASIMCDAHVIGDVRSIRGEFRDMDWRIVTWAEEDAKAQEARDLCQKWMQGISPNKVADWDEIMWQMTSAIFKGYFVHELVWDYWNGYIVPVQILDRPNRRILFDHDAEPLLVTRQNPTGKHIDEPYRFAISRHMASITNPYGQALLSACFWPWSFKTGGWKMFVKYCERHGLPWPVAKFGKGSSDKDINDLGEAMQAMVDSGYALIPDDSSVELLIANHSGSGLPQENLINLANREMSKALTSQAMVAELQGTGARAASDTAKQRQSLVNKSDRGIAASTFAKIFRWITDFNFGEDVPSPELEFFKTEAAGKDRAETYKTAAEMGARPSKKAMLEELNIPIAIDDEDALLPQSSVATANFAAADGNLKIATNDFSLDAASAADDAIEVGILEPIARMLAQAEKDGKTLTDVQDDLIKIVGQMDNSDLITLTRKALEYAFVKGYADDNNE